MKIQDFMTQGVYTVRPQDSLEAAAQQMWEHDCGALPVVDENGRVVAMLTDRDVCMAGYTQGKPLSAIRVSTAMSKRVVTCHPQDTMSMAERAMRQHQVRRLPVVDDQGQGKSIATATTISDVATSHGWGRERSGFKRVRMTKMTSTWVAKDSMNHPVRNSASPFSGR